MVLRRRKVGALALKLNSQMGQRVVTRSAPEPGHSEARDAVEVHGAAALAHYPSGERGANGAEIVRVKIGCVAADRIADQKPVIASRARPRSINAWVM